MSQPEERRHRAEAPGGLSCFYPLPRAWTGWSSSAAQGHVALERTDMGIQLQEDATIRALTPSLHSLRQPALAALRTLACGAFISTFPLQAPQRPAPCHMLMIPDVTHTLWLYVHDGRTTTRIQTRGHGALGNTGAVTHSRFAYLET